MRKSVFFMVCLIIFLEGQSQAQFPQMLKSHRQGTLWTSVTNYGLLGSEGGDIYDPEYLDPAPSAQFPGDSDIEYLFQATIWIGAVVEDPDYPGNFDTLVSIGCDGWWSGIEEFSPIDSLTRISDIADDEMLALYADTTIAGISPDPNDGRPHIPLGVKVTSHSYTWASPPDNDFALIKYTISNILDNDLNDVYIGFYYDGDVMHSLESSYNSEEGAQDDICGFLNINSTNAAYIIDNNGQPSSFEFNDRSSIGVCGISFLGSSQPDLQLSFNWWISNINAQLDWGLQLIANYGGPFPGDGNGTPGGDKAKYTVMSNGEIDYEQYWANFDYMSQGWIPPAPNAADLTNGYDTRFLFSFGPMDIVPADSVWFYIALVAGDSLHTDPYNYENNLRYSTNDSTSILNYISNLDFYDFVTNSQQAYDRFLGIVGIDSDPAGSFPYSYILAQSYPNPFNARCRISFSIPEQAYVTVEIYNILGQTVATPLSERLAAGEHSLIFDAEDLSSGFYFYKVTADGLSRSKKMVLLK